MSVSRDAHLSSGGSPAARCSRDVAQATLHLKPEEERTVGDRWWRRHSDDELYYRRILKLLQQGEKRDAVEQLWPRFTPQITWAASTYHFPDGVVEECVQDFYVKLLQLDTTVWKPVTYLRPFLWTSFRNHLRDCYDYYKRRGGETAVSNLSSNDEDEGDNMSMDIFPAKPSDGAMDPDGKRCVQRAWHAFKNDHPVEAEVIVLKVIEGWSHKELAVYMEKTYGYGATREYVSSSYEKCREYIQRFCGECLPHA
jgi:DNA-directed RNA polymerase specialized sigma24 family protein